MDSVDADLAAFSAPILGRFDVDFPRSDAADVPAQRIIPWMRFASQHLFGTCSVSGFLLLLLPRSICSALLSIKRISKSLLQQFDKVYKLKLSVSIEQVHFLPPMK